MIEIKNIYGETLFQVPLLADSVAREELMAADYVQLSWNSGNGDVLPVGSYVLHEGEKYSLMEAYAPERKDEREFSYSPQFHSRIMRWQKALLPVYTYQSDGVTVKSKEFDWNFTGTPSDAMFMVRQAILNETGEAWTVLLSGGLPATINISSESSSIWSVLSDIAEACETEWWADKANNIIHLSKCEHGSPVVLEAGVNVKMPSVTKSSEDYFTRFYALGSSRNVTQFDGMVQGSLINKRLTLDPVKYPLGYKDVKGHFENGVFVSDLLPEEVSSTVLYFEDVYPSSDLKISGVRKRLRYRMDDDGNKVMKNGQYELYAIWYFSIKDFEFSEDLIIKNQTLSVHFKTGKLQGREFELKYHPEDKSVADVADVDESFSVKAGEYEIIFDEQTEGFIIPSVDYIIPEDRDEVILFNIEMPAEYTASAMDKLEEELDKELANRQKDNSSYEFDSNPVAFYRDGTSLSLGQKVTYINNGATLETRVMMVEKRLDYAFEQRLRVGNEQIKGSRQQLKDEVREVGREVNKQREQGDISSAIQREHSWSLMQTMGRYYAMKNTMDMLQGAFENFSQGINPVTVQTMGLLVGDESLQFKFTASRNDLTSINCPLVYDPHSGRMAVTRASSLIHLTLGLDDITAKNVRTAQDYKSWDMDDGWYSDPLDPNKGYYVYAVVPMNGATGSYDVSPTHIGMRSVANVFYLLVGIINPEYAGKRDFATLYGYTQILPSQISTDNIRSADGKTYFDLAHNVLNVGEKTGLSGTDEYLRMWAGAEFSDRNNAPFRVYDDGYVQLVNAYLQGEVYAQGGKIGPLYISEDGLGITEFPADISLGSIFGALALMKDIVSFSTMVKESASSGTSIRSVVINMSSKAADMPAMLINSSLSANGKNIGIKCTNGMFSGLRPMTKVITSGKSSSSRNLLDAYDYSVLINLTSGICYMKLPDNPLDGQEYWVETLGAKIDLTSSIKMWAHYKGEYETSHKFESAGVIRFKYYAEANVWTYSWVEYR